MDQLGQPSTIGADQVIGEQHIGSINLGEHLGLRDCGALVLGDAEFQLQASDFAGFVSLDVGTQAIGRAGDGQCLADIATDEVGI